MKKLFILLICILTLQHFSVKAQDTIVLANGTEVLSKVTEITSNTVKYKDYSNLEGPDYILDHKEISLIKFVNGSIKEFEAQIDEDVEYINDVPIRREQQDLSADKKSARPVRQDFEVSDASGYHPIPGQKYSTNKQIYNHRDYVRRYGDPYDPALAGVASYFIPGLGQMICGEAGRGLAFMGGVYGSFIVAGVGFAVSPANLPYYGRDYYYSEYSSDGAALTGAVLGIAGIVSGVGLYIYSIVDAVQVAKVNNLYMRDLRENYVSVTLKPYIESSPSLSPVKNRHFGLKLNVAF